MFKLQQKKTYTQKEDAMKKVTPFTKKVKGQVTNSALNKATRIVGIELGQNRAFFKGLPCSSGTECKSIFDAKDLILG